LLQDVRLQCPFLLGDMIKKYYFCFFPVADKNILLPMFLKHYAYILSKKCRENIKVGNFPSVDMDKFKKFLIPLPPLEVQKRIVEVLDNFEKTCKELNIELSSEIEIKQNIISYCSLSVIAKTGRLG